MSGTIIKLIPIINRLAPPDPNDPNFDEKLHDHRMALSTTVFALLVIALMSYSWALLPWSPMRIALAEDLVASKASVEEMKQQIEDRLVRVEQSINENSIRTMLSQHQTQVRQLEDALFNVQRAIQQRSDEGRPKDAIYEERKDQLQHDLNRAKARLSAFEKRHQNLIVDWMISGDI